MWDLHVSPGQQSFTKVGILVYKKHTKATNADTSLLIYRLYILVKHFFLIHCIQNN